MVVAPSSPSMASRQMYFHKYLQITLGRQPSITSMSSRNLKETGSGLFSCDKSWYLHGTQDLKESRNITHSLKRRKRPHLSAPYSQATLKVSNTTTMIRGRVAEQSSNMVTKQFPQRWVNRRPMRKPMTQLKTAK